jgi:hypothetical protein
MLQEGALLTGLLNGGFAFNSLAVVPAVFLNHAFVAKHVDP